MVPISSLQETNRKQNEEVEVLTFLLSVSIWYARRTSALVNNGIIELLWSEREGAFRFLFFDAEAFFCDWAGLGWRVFFGDYTSAIRGRAITTSTCGHVCGKPCLRPCHAAVTSRRRHSESAVPRPHRRIQLGDSGNTYGRRLPCGARR